MAHPGGRPPLYEDADTLQKAIDEYFKEHEGLTIVKNEDGSIMVNDKGDIVEIIKPPTMSGLAYHLGFESRQSLYDYKKNVKFSYIIKRARLRIEMFAESMLYHGKPTGPIFHLKNMEWSDRQTIVNENPDNTVSREEFEQLENDVKNILAKEL